MTTAINPTISPFAQLTTEPNANAIRFIDEKLTSVPASDVPEDFRKLSRFFPVIVLVPKSAVADKATRKNLAPNKAGTDFTDTMKACSPLDAARAWLENSNDTDTFEFGGVKGCFSTMETRRMGEPVAMTRKEFKMLEYLIKNPRRVLSRDELLNEVWGYDSYPCTRTVDTHILRLRRKLEAEPSRPRHFLTVHSTGYKFLP
jgi:DNA-binding response OmpR family regulator